MKLAFVGFGAQTQENLLPTCMTVLGVEVAAICDIDESKRRQATAVFGSSRVYADHRELMEEVRPDAIIVACYPDDHFRIALDAIDRGVPVFIEKPPAPSSAKMKILADRARLKQLTTGVGMNFRFAEVTRRFSAIADGHFNMISLRQLANKPVGRLWGYASPLRSFLHAQTIHGLDMLIHLCGPIRDLHVAGGQDGSRIVFTVIITFENGAHGSLITSNTSPHLVFDFDAICRDKINISSRSLWDLTVADTTKIYAGGERKKWRDSWSPSPLASGYDRSGYLGQIVDFIEAIRAGRVESGTCFNSLLETYRCLDLIEEKCSSNEIVKVEMALA
jgi:predicted dehydrogenase